MRKLIATLSILLVIQVLASYYLLSDGEDLSVFRSEKKLLELKLSGVDRIEISERDKDSLVIEKKDNTWTLPNSHSFPVSESKIKSAISKLLETTRGWPVGKTEGAAIQLKLSDKSFEKKISFFKEDKALKTLVLGSSPEFRRIHVKLADEPLIYSIEYSSFEASTTAKDWYDTELLSLKRDNIKEVHANGFVLEAKDNKFTLPDLSENEEMDPDKLGSFLSDVQNISFVDVLGTELADKEPVYSFFLETASGDKLEYKFFGPMEEDAFYQFHVSSFPYLFKAQKSAVARIKEVTRGSLVKEKEPGAEEVREETASSEPA